MTQSTTPQPKRSRKVLRIAGYLLGGLLVIAVIFAGFTYYAGSKAKAELKAQYPAPKKDAGS